MSRGYVYILTNEAMPGLVKIGKTTRCVDGRANEIYQTGVPLPFVVYNYVETPDCHTLELTMHEILADLRVSQSREFFAINAFDAENLLQIKHIEQLSLWLDDFVDDYSIVATDLHVCEANIARLADELGEPEPLIADALGCITADEIRPAVIRVYDRIARNKARRENAQL